MPAPIGPFCGLCGRPQTVCGGACAPLHTLDPPRWCVTCGHRLDVQVYPDHIESSCKVCRVRAGRAALHQAADEPPVQAQQSQQQ